MRTVWVCSPGAVTLSDHVARTQSLLEMFALGVQDVEEFQQVLSSELGGLEVCCCRGLQHSLKLIGRHYAGFSADTCVFAN